MDCWFHLWKRPLKLCSVLLQASRSISSQFMECIAVDASKTNYFMKVTGRLQGKKSFLIWLPAQVTYCGSEQWAVFSAEGWQWEPVAIVFPLLSALRLSPALHWKWLEKVIGKDWNRSAGMSLVTADLSRCLCQSSNIKYFLVNAEYKMMKRILSIRSESSFTEFNNNFWNIRLTNAYRKG